MIQTTLFFILGFLCAGFLALMIAPAIWRRAVVLTRRRIEASMPLTMDEIQADKDRLRAGFAMSTRRLEMSLQSSREKAAEQIVEINRNREEIKRLGEENDGKDAVIRTLEASGDELRAQLRQCEEQIQLLTDNLAGQERQLEKRALELEQLGRMYDEASFQASSRQIELVAQETRLEKLSGDLSSMRRARKDAESRMRETAAESKTAREALRAEGRKIAALERKLERLVSQLSDREEKLERRERELGRLRAQLKGAEEAGDLPAGETESGATQGGGAIDKTDKALAKLKGDRTRQEERLRALTRENRRLRAELGEARRAAAGEGEEEQRESAVLRDQINALAAEVVNLTAMLDEPGSPIRKALALGTDAGPPAAAVDNGATTSLADRVRALQEAAASR